MPPRFHHPHRIVLQRKGQEPETLNRPPLGTGYSHELIEVTECVRGGRTESKIMPLADTLAVQRILNEASEQLGVYHSEDSSCGLCDAPLRAVAPSSEAPEPAESRPCRQGRGRIMRRRSGDPRTPGRG